MVAPVLRGLADAGALVAVFSQDDPEFPDDLGPLAVSDDRELDTSFALDIDTVPTLLLWSAGIEVARTVGWSRSQWEAVAGIEGLGADLPALRPGCGSRTHDPDIADQRAVAQMLPKLRSRRLELGTGEDEMEALFARASPTGCQWCRPHPSASRGCSAAPPATRTTSSRPRRRPRRVHGGEGRGERGNGGLPSRVSAGGAHRGRSRVHRRIQRRTDCCAPPGTRARWCS